MKNEHIIANRLYNNYLITKAHSTHEVLGRTLGVQAQYANHGLFNIFNRMDPADIGQLLIGWGQRNTVHYYTYENWQQINQLLQSQARWPLESMGSRGIDLDASLEKLRYFLLSNKGATRNEMSHLFGDDWKHLTNWSAMFLESSRRGNLYISRQSTESMTQYFYWNEVKERLETDDAAKLNMLKEYLNAYGPASKKDVAHFFGVNLSFFDVDFDTKFSSIISDGITLYFATKLLDIAPPEVVLLGKFDPLLVAYKDKHIMFSEENKPLIWKKAGQISAIILIEGVFSGTWRYKIQGKKMNYYISTTKKLTKNQQRKIESKFVDFAILIGKQLNQTFYELL